MQSRYYLKDLIYFIDRALYDGDIPAQILRAFKTEKKNKMTIKLVRSPDNIAYTKWALKSDSPMFIHFASIFVPFTTNTKIYFDEDLMMIDDHYDEDELHRWFKNRLVKMINDKDNLMATIDNKTITIEKI